MQQELIETVLTCPLGSKCQEVKNGKIYQCAWFKELQGRNPITGETANEKGCAISWTPILLVENALQMRSNAAAIESFRNEMVASNVAAMKTIAAIDSSGQSLNHNMEALNGSTTG
jgi:hypothetical protein